MYTRCPSCRAEISFEPPANMETLPDGYKHRIKCPSCGVTIGVKINKIDAAPATLVQQSSAYNQQTSFEPVYAEDMAQAPSKKAAKQDKRSGVGRNITMMIMSLLFIAASVVGFLINSGTIKNPVLGFGVFDGISYRHEFCFFERRFCNKHSSRHFAHFACRAIHSCLHQLPCRIHLRLRKEIRQSVELDLEHSHRRRCNLCNVCQSHRL